MPDPALSRAAVWPSIPHSTPRESPDKSGFRDRRHRKVASLSARIVRQKVELDARSHEAVADFLHRELVGLEVRLWRLERRP